MYQAELSLGLSQPVFHETQTLMLKVSITCDELTPLL